MTDHSLDRLESIREGALRRIAETHVAGRDTRHNRLANLQAVRSVVEGDPHYTWDIRGVDRFSFEEILEAIAAVTGCSRDPSVTSGGGYISPAATLRGLEATAEAIATAAHRRGRFLLGTGHPGSLLLFYIRLAHLIRSWGGSVLEPALSAQVPPNLDLAYIDGVAVTTDRASVPHSHSHDAMDQMLAHAGHVDLVVADHGYASGAITAGVPVVAVMDTNDPALALAQRLGANLIIITMDDNRPPSCYLPILETIREFGEHLEPGLTALAEPPGTGAASALAHDRLRTAEQLVAEQIGVTQGLDDLMTGLLEGFRDQLLQTALTPDEHDRLASDPYLELVVHRRLHDALHAVVQRRLQVAEVELDAAQIARYLDNGAAGNRHRLP
ncbi:MAG: phosphatase [Chloroflexi bacterium]|nr:phosphatase [Chloroflexota bacterium]